VPRKYANDKEKRTVVRERQRFCCVIVALERVVCNGVQREEAQCMIDTAQ
jgi:hypothetical protein